VDDAVKFYERGKALYSTGDDRGALAALDQSLALDGSNPHAHFRRGLCLGQLGDFEAARASYHRAIGLDGSWWHFWFELGQVEKQLGRMQEAEKALRESVSRDNASAGAHYTFGLLLSDRGAEQEAAAQWQLAIAAEPNHTDAHYNLGIYYLHGAGADPARALDHFKTVVRVEPNDDRGLAKVIQALFRLGRYDEAQDSRVRAGSLVRDKHQRGQIRVAEFCIDQFAIADSAVVYVYECAIRRALGSSIEIWYAFKIVRNQAIERVFQLEVSDYARETGAHPFLLGVRYPDGSHATLPYAWAEEPAYTELKNTVVAAMSPDAPPPLASSRPA
jgi:tetratricopeptide (TPR) repeat protein